MKFLEFSLFIAFILSCARSHKFTEQEIEAYCNVKCKIGGKGNHTVCRFKCEVAPECTEFEHLELNDKERQYIMDLHNFYKNLVASGGDRRGGTEAGKNMMVLNYDMDTELMIYCWAVRCIDDHDLCRHPLKFKSAGQNLYRHGEGGGSRFNAAQRKFLNESVFLWYDEIKHMNKSSIKRLPMNPGHMIGHFTQMVWHNTKWMGCTRVAYRSPDRKWKYVAVNCNYSPMGNTLGMSVYHFGTGCTGKEKPNSEFPSLCGENIILSQDRDTSLFKVPDKSTDPSVKPSSTVTLALNVLTLHLILLFWFAFYCYNIF